MYFLPDWAALEMCLLRFASQFALSAAELANTWNDLSAWLIWNALDGSEYTRQKSVDHDGHTEKAVTYTNLAVDLEILHQYQSLIELEAGKNSQS